MKYALGNMLNGAGGLNADQLSLDLQFAADKTLTARKGPTPVLTRASGATYIGSDGLIHGVDTSTTSNTIGTGSKTFTLDATAGQDQFWRTGDAVEATNGTNSMFGAVTSYDSSTQSLVCNITSITGSGTFASWRIGYRGPRFDHNPVSPFASRGLLMEENRTNLVFPSETLTTQTRTVTAIAHTLSFYGTGTVVLSGTHVATVVGTGAYPTRTTLTFTPTAGSLTLTVTGSVTQAQLEAGSAPTSYIPTTTSSLTRSADFCSITAANFTGTNFYNPNEGTIIAIGSLNTANINPGPEVFKFNDGTNNNRIQIGMTNVPSEAVRPVFVAAGSLTYNSTVGTATIGVQRKIGTAYNTNDAISAFNGTIGTQDTTVTIPTGINQVLIGISFSGQISSIRYYKKRLANSKLVSLTT